MESALIDELYEVYLKENDILAEEIIMSKYLLPESSGGRGVFVEHVKNYINSNMNNLPNYFSCQTVESDKDVLIRNLETAMKNFALAMDYYRIDIRQSVDADHGLVKYDYENDVDDFLDYYLFRIRF